EAIETLKGITDSQEHGPVAYYYLARIYARLDRPEDSLDALEKAIELNPSFISAISDLGKFYEEQDRIDDAIALYRSYLERNSKETAVRELLVHTLVREERYEEAKRELKIILDQEPDHPNGLLMMGMVEAGTGNYTKALEYFKRVRESSPENYEITMQMGSLQRELELYEEAIKTFLDAAALQPDQFEPHLYLAVIYNTIDRPEEALDRLKTALSLKPDRTSIRTFMAQILTDMENYEDAIVVLEEGLENNTDDPNLLYQLGIVYDRSGRFSRTEKIMQRIIEIDPSHYDAMNYLGYSWADRGIRLEDALVLVRNALEIKPDAPYIIDSLGWIYYHMGHYQEALEKILEAEKAMPDDPTILEHLGDTYQKLGNQEKAEEYWKRTLEVDPDNERILDKLR
ncbi:tetratricopeptide repeat protein, partial [bacterium]